MVKNDDASAITVTLVTQGTVDSQAVADRTVTVAAGAIKLIGPFPTATYNDSSGNVQVTYSAVTSITVGAVQFTPVT